MMRHARAFLTVIAIILVACATAPMPRVVTVIEAYVALLPLDEAKYPGLDGRVICDLAGFPVIYVRMGLPPKQTRGVLHHERVHAEQAMAHPRGCFGLREEMSRDTMFRLRMESAAFCNVYATQRAMQEVPDPDREKIFNLLSERYAAAYDSSAVEQAMTLCR